MKHCILVKYIDSIDDERKLSLIAEHKEHFRGLLELDGIHEIEYIPNVVPIENRYDLLIRMDMDKEALALYNSSPLHKSWKEKYTPIFEKKAIFDYEP